MAKSKRESDIDPKAPLLANAARVITRRLDEMLAYEGYLADASLIHELHQMRIAAKRLRYTLEIFQDIYTRYTPYGKAFTETISKVRDLQEILGEIHDADVLAPRLIEQLARQLKDGYGADAGGLPVIGVHHVDLEACAGLLALCQQT